MNKKNTNGFDSDSLQNYAAEAESIIRRLEDSKNPVNPEKHKFCHYFFFYGCKDSYTSKMLPMPSWYDMYSDMPNMAQFRSSMLAYLRSAYQVEVSPKDFSTIVYEALWAEGTWAPLKSYKYQSPFFVWLKEVAKKSVLTWLKRDRYFPKSSPRSLGNTRLALLSKPAQICQLIIDEHLQGSKYYDLMCSIYVARFMDVEIMVKYHMTKQEFKEAKEEGERELKDSLLRSTSWYEKEVLRDKIRDNLSVSSEFVADMEKWLVAKQGESSLADVFGVNLSDEEVREKVIDLLYRLSAKMDWTDSDRLHWRQRFIDNIPPVEVAETFGHTRAWVDTRFSLLNKEIKPSLKRWWIAHAA